MRGYYHALDDQLTASPKEEPRRKPNCGYLHAT
jgi:hypothetical protein